MCTHWIVPEVASLPPALTCVRLAGHTVGADTYQLHLSIALHRRDATIYYYTTKYM
jgi:hypothetical protein